MKLSIIVPIYKRAKDLGGFLERIADQTSGDFELIAVIDTFSDKCLQVVDDFFAKNKKFDRKLIKLIFNSKRVGRDKAIEMATKSTTGNYLIIISLNDSISKNFVRDALRVITKNQTDIIEFNFKSKRPINYQHEVNEKLIGQSLKIAENQSLLVSVCPFDINKFFKVDVFKKAAKIKFTTPINSRFSIENTSKMLYVSETYSFVGEDFFVFNSEISSTYNPVQFIKQWKSLHNFMEKNTSYGFFKEWEYSFIKINLNFIIHLVREAKNKVLFNEYLRKLKKEIAKIDIVGNSYLLKDAKLLKEIKKYND